MILAWASPITSFFRQAYYCTDCVTPYSSTYKHSCSSHCQICRSSECLKMGSEMTCIHCHQQCRSIDCFNRHKERGVGKKQISPCNAMWRCTICLQTIKVSERSPTQHRCSEYKCSLCHLLVLLDPRCYMR